MRTFVALSFNGEFLDALDGKLDILREEHPDLRWTPLENLHITLAFMGELDNRAFLSVCDTVRETCENRPAFELRTGTVLTLPHGRNAGVLALGLGTGSDKAGALASRFERLLAERARAEGFVFERGAKHSFKPHITLARRGRGEIVISNELAAFAPKLSAHIDAVTVYTSELRLSGAEYTPRAVFELKSLC